MGFSLGIAWEKLPQKVQKFLLYGDEEQKFEKSSWNMGVVKAKMQSFPGILKDLEATMRTTSSDNLGQIAYLFSMERPARTVREAGFRHTRICTAGWLLIGGIFLLLRSTGLGIIKQKAGKENCLRVEDAMHGLEQSALVFINEVGLGYLGLDRPIVPWREERPRRSRLATQLGMGLVGSFMHWMNQVWACIR